MESLTRSPSIPELLGRVRAQVAAVEGLAEQLRMEQRRTRRHDQAEQVRALARWVGHRVHVALESESACKTGFTNASFACGALNFAGGSLMALLTGGSRDSLRVGAKMAAEHLSKNPPFGTVLVAVNSKAAFEDLATVVALSKLARESGRAEEQVRLELESTGCLLLTPEAFSDAMARIAHEILEGKLILPEGDLPLAENTPNNGEGA